MKDPRPLRNRCLMVVALGICGAWYWYAFHNPNEITPHLIGLAGAFLLMLGGVFFLVVVFDAARYGRLVRGKDVLVRWQVPPDQWHAFAALNHGINQTEGSLGFRVPRQHIPRTEPVEVVIGQTGLLIDGEFHQLPHRGVVRVWPPQFVDGTASYLEFPMTSYEEDGTPAHHAVRAPVPATAEARQDVLRLQAYFQAHLATAQQSLPAPCGGAPHAGATGREQHG
jgi:hypothetical protein